MNELSATNTLFKSIYDTRSMHQTIESTNAIIPQSIANTAPAISSITIPQPTPVISTVSTSAPVITAPLTIKKQLLFIQM